MSLFVFGASSKVAQGVIRRLYKSGQFDKIVCADLYPNYWGIQRYLYFKESLEGIQTKTKICDQKIIEKSDLVNSISKNNYVLYITHDYYANCFSKLNLILQTANIVKDLKHVQKFVTLTPVELDHYSEPNPSNSATGSEDQTKQIYPDVVQIKSDLTFGPDSTVITRLLQRIASGESICFKPSGSGPSPVSVENIAEGVEKIFAGQEKGSRYIAQGEKRLDWNSTIHTLEKALTGGHHAKLNSCVWEKLFSPSSSSIFSEYLFTPQYLNLCQFISQYQPPNSAGSKSLKDLGVTLQDFEGSYKQGSIDGHKYKFRTSGLEYRAQDFLY